MLESRATKGRIVEDLVQRLHRNTGFMVRSRVQLPVRGNGNRRREIDVLVTGEMLGRPMHIAFECKNYGQPIDVATIGEFRDKLEDVGIPVQHGILVATANGFTAGARERSDQLGIRVLILDGLSDDRLSAVTYEAFQSIVHVMLVVTNIRVVNSAPRANWVELLCLRDRKGRLQGTVLDLVWAQWRDGKVTLELGQETLEVQIPRGWTWRIEGEDIESTVTVTVEKIAYVLTLSGTFTQVSLRDAATGELDRMNIDAQFPELIPQGSMVTVALTEEDLATHLRKAGRLHIIQDRIPLPRIRHELYWPPSERAVLRLASHVRELEQQGVTDFEPHLLTFADIEGYDLTRVWEPIWPAHPASTDPGWPWSKSKKPRPDRIAFSGRKRLRRTFR